MFIRLKNINGQHYAYRVKNSWTKKGARQKAMKYLGKALILPEADGSSYESFLSNPTFLDIAGLKEIIDSLITWEFSRRGIEKKDEGFMYGDKIIYMKNLVPHAKDKALILKVGEGYLCHETVQTLLHFRREEEEDHETAGTRLATAFLATGINVPKEVFVKVYEKLSYFDEPEVEVSLKNFE
ncbi:MAG: hypothetical protein ABIH34_05745 [Nanoarchaeota archaeon]